MERRCGQRCMTMTFQMFFLSLVFVSRFVNAAAWASPSLGVRSAMVGRMAVVPEITTICPHRQRVFPHRTIPLRLTENRRQSLDEKASKVVDKKIPLALLLWKFSRPHTLIGSAVAIPTLHCLAAPELSSIFTLNALRSVIVSMFPALLINIYVTGLNQITDVDIDKINKPDLPIPAGLLSVEDAKLIVSVCLVVGLLSGAVVGTAGLNMALWGSALLGTLYSMPPFRLKQFPLLAATCIVAVRGVVINVGFFAHAQQFVFGSSMGIAHMLLTDMKCILSSLFYGIFGIVIALMKDVPDVRGDAIANIRSFSVRVGQKAIFTVARRLLSFLLCVFGIGFLNGIRTAPTSTVMACRALVGVASMFAGFKVRQKSLGVDPENSRQVYEYYMYLWRIFYMSYFALPFVK